MTRVLLCMAVVLLTTGAFGEDGGFAALPAAVCRCGLREPGEQTTFSFTQADGSWRMRDFWKMCVTLLVSPPLQAAAGTP